MFTQNLCEAFAWSINAQLMSARVWPPFSLMLLQKCYYSLTNSIHENRKSKKLPFELITWYRSSSILLSVLKSTQSAQVSIFAPISTSSPTPIFFSFAFCSLSALILNNFQMSWQEWVHQKYVLDPSIGHLIGFNAVARVEEDHQPSWQRKFGMAWLGVFVFVWCLCIWRGMIWIKQLLWCWNISENQEGSDENSGGTKLGSLCDGDVSWWDPH